MTQELTLRNVSSEDKWRLFEWRNQDYIRAVSINSQILQAESHTNWFEKIIAAEFPRILVCEWQGEPVGIIQIEKWDEATRVGVWGCYLGELNQHPALGPALVILGLGYGFTKLSAMQMEAEVLEINKNMVSIHKRLKLSLINVVKDCEIRTDGQILEKFQYRVERAEWDLIKERALQMFPTSFRVALVNCLEHLPNTSIGK